MAQTQDRSYVEDMLPMWNLQLTGKLQDSGRDQQMHDLTDDNFSLGSLSELTAPIIEISKFLGEQTLSI